MTRKKRCIILQTNEKTGFDGMNTELMEENSVKNEYADIEENKITEKESKGSIEPVTELKTCDHEVGDASEEEKAELYRRRKMSYSIRLLCALYLSYLVYSLATGINETSGNERVLVIFFIVFFAIFDIWCYISGFRGLKELKEKQ